MVGENQEEMTLNLLRSW